ncbi:YhcN/YlaJ family sporulation lipoprotein [Thermoanaerobacterium sp. DL9XJH110]|uniref:YhcN/YlaJ family sporulation lipoprotein n=1 Tax=Thermoanaerobacterium sp. DL9XJH110 TaxID=3386643 RepID=UPI003BB5B87F
MKRFLASILIMITVFALTTGGCAVSRRPAPKPAPPSRIVRRTPAKKPAPSPANALASKLSNAAAKVEGVKSATVVVSGSTAFVGLEIKPGVEAKKTNEIKTKVADAVKRADTRIKAVNVTTDPNLVTRLKKIAEGIRAGKPISSFTRELTEITRRMVPKGKVK